MQKQRRKSAALSGYSILVAIDLSQRVIYHIKFVLAKLDLQLLTDTALCVSPGQKGRCIVGFLMTRHNCDLICDFNLPYFFFFFFYIYSTHLPRDLFSYVGRCVASCSVSETFFLFFPL